MNFTRDWRNDLESQISNTLLRLSTHGSTVKPGSSRPLTDGIRRLLLLEAAEQPWGISPRPYCHRDHVTLVGLACWPGSAVLASIYSTSISGLRPRRMGISYPTREIFYYFIFFFSFSWPQFNKRVGEKICRGLTTRDHATRTSPAYGVKITSRFKKKNEKYISYLTLSLSSTFSLSFPLPLSISLSFSLCLSNQ